MDRQIVCFAIPSLEIALARLSQLSLRTRPLAVAAIDTPRALLREVSTEAEREGLYVGMTLDRARHLCPSLHVSPPNPRQVATANHSILSVIQRYAPTWEPFLPGSLMMDLTGTTRLFGSACDVAAKIQADVLTQFRLFMSPLSIRTLPGVHRPCMRIVLKRLDDLNLRSLGDVADSPLDALEVVLGNYAGQLSRWAQGIDPTPVLPPVAHPALNDTITLNPDEVDDARLQRRLADSLQQLCRTLRSQRRICGGLSLTLRYSDQREVTTKARVIPETCWEIDLSGLLQGLFQRAFRRRIRLRMMTVTLTDLTGFAEQGSLFEERPPEEQWARNRSQRLAVALDHLHQRFGEQAIRYGRTQ